MKKWLPKILLVVFVIGVFGAFKHFELGQYFTTEAIKAKQADLEAFHAENSVLMSVGFVGLYILAAALNLPIAAIMTVLGGFIFGLFWGTILVSIGSTAGATLAFLGARYLMGNWVQQKYGSNLKTINRGIEKDGWSYLLTLRLIPIFPFFLINLLMGMTKMRAIQFFFVSQLGMFPGTIVYVNAGKEFASVETFSFQGILTPGMIIALVLLASFSLVVGRIVDYFKTKKAIQPFIARKPRSFEFNHVVVGAGSAGLVSAYLCAAFKTKVALIERNKMGGDCLNTGCVPSKALIKSAKIISMAKRAEEFGFNKIDVDYDFPKIMDRIQRVIKTIEPHDSVERYTGLGVDCVQGSAKILSPWEVEVTDSSGGKKTLTTQNIIVATGARPFVPPIPGIDQVNALNSDTIWNLRELPKKMVVLGGGPIGSELAQCFARLGSEVTQVEMSDRIMGREDKEISEMVMEKFKKEGIRLLTQHKAKEFKVEGNQKVLICESNGQDVRIEFDQVLVAIGRRANVAGFGLEELGVKLTNRGTIETNEYLRTNLPNVYGCGDVVGPYQFTHTAAHMAFYAAFNSTFGFAKKFAVDYSVVPWATFTDPEVARVGLNETDAKEQGIPYEVTTYGIDDLDRAIADEEAHGVVKVLTKPGSDKILGATIVGDHAGDIIVEYVAAMRHGFGMNKILGTIHIYPTLGESNKFAAGVWKRNRKPEKLLEYVEKFQKWRRS